MDTATQTIIPGLESVTDTRHLEDPLPGVDDELAARVAAMSDRDLDSLITGRTRLGSTQAEQITAWNLAITEEQNRG